jgi:single-strand DNA-binding protein
MSDLRLPEINRIVLSGRLTRQPDRRYAADGTQVTSMSVAFHRRYRGADGRPQEHTGFVTVVTYRRLAEVCRQYLRKGSPVLVEGRLQMREWATPQGAKRQRLEIRAEQVHFLEKMPAASGPDDPPAPQAEEGELFGSPPE